MIIILKQTIMQALALSWMTQKIFFGQLTLRKPQIAEYNFSLVVLLLVMFEDVRWLLSWKTFELSQECLSDCLV